MILDEKGEQDESPITGRNKTWEENHTAIIKAIDKLIFKNERLCSVTEIADFTGLSRNTVYKHLGSFEDGKLMIENVEQCKFLSSKVLAKVMELAVGGDLRACRLALQIVGVLGTSKQKKQ